MGGFTLTLVLTPERPAAGTSNAALNRILAQHGVGPLESVEPMPRGGLNRVLLVNQRYVLRYRDPGYSTGSLRREAAVLSQVSGSIRVPTVVGCGLDDALGEYLLAERIHGRNLLSAWLEHPDSTLREWWTEQWIDALRAIHSVQYPGPGEFAGGELQLAASWRRYLEGRIHRRIDRLMRTPGVDRGLLIATERFVRRVGPALQDGRCCLVHRDFHFANVLVDGPRLAAVIDFELAEVGPIDYELDTICRFLRDPAPFSVEPTVSQPEPARFKSVGNRLRRGYPELFLQPRLPERLSIYALDYELSKLAQFHDPRWVSRLGSAAALAAAQTSDQIADILRGDYCGLAAL